MGEPKHLLEIAGETLLERAIRRLSPGASEVLVAAPARLAAQPPGARRVFDGDGEEGPLAGIAAGLRAAHTDIVVAVGVDLPLVDAHLVARLAAATAGVDAAVPRLAGRAHPVCAAYRRSALPAITRALEGGNLRLTSLLEVLNVRWVTELAPAALVNLNRPQDLALIPEGPPPR